ncbi:sugar phosphate isomerase/epimerase family protein [Geoalkalibacter halelectricus]|uniref:sugar phosphate isomerase/epimerase family protein n=1 Tax=Geoalkalibacter halelectricus TaxID=2847045 RepID=UPI003D1CD272
MSLHSRLHVSLPYRMLDERGAFLLSRGLQPEIAFKGMDFDDAAIWGVLRHWAGQFRSAGLRVTVHAPFMDLNPGALEPLVRDATRRRLDQALEAAALLEARCVVMHPGYDRWRYGGNEDLWLEPSLEFWRPLEQRAREIGTVLALENVFEDGPGSLQRLLEGLDSPLVGHCFDVGHWHLFCRDKVSLEEWFGRLGRHMVHVHLHDNRGEGDDHLPPGQGLIPFTKLRDLVQDQAPRASLALEVHDPAGLAAALGAVSSLFGV